MLELDKIKSVYKTKETLDMRLLSQLKVIRVVLGNMFTYKDFEYYIPNDILDIDDIQDCGDGILDIFFMNSNLEVSFLCINEELLPMSREELEQLKENK